MGIASPFGKGARTVKLGNARNEIGRLLWPVEGARFSSRFGYRGSSFHEGVDLSAEEGSPIYAAHSGKVLFAGRGLRGYGNLVVIRGDNLMTVYGHTSRLYVSRGEEVQRGDYIAAVGETGHASGPHLHFETRLKSDRGKWVAVDPMVFFMQQQ
jgi:murein DD-endopeptidase MepM/ murein hydrolase activator NlpD